MDSIFRNNLTCAGESDRGRTRDVSDGCDLWRNGQCLQTVGFDVHFSNVGLSAGNCDGNNM
jgi:hypothetical protein